MGQEQWEPLQWTRKEGSSFPWKTGRRGLKPGVELEIRRDKNGLLLTPLLPRPVRVKAGRAKWGREAFPDAGEATFGD